jgi:hypothetical protein
VSFDRLAFFDRESSATTEFRRTAYSRGCRTLSQAFVAVSPKPRVTRVQVFYSADYVSARDEFDTTRKAADVVASLVTDPIAPVQLVSPPPLDLSLLGRVHDADTSRRS